MNETEMRERLVRWGALLFGRGYTAGSSGNLSVRVEGGYLVTPTNSCLGLLDPARLTRLGRGMAHGVGRSADEGVAAAPRLL